MSTKHSLSEHEKVYPAGQVVFEQDEPGARMYIIKRGQVRIYRTVGSEELMLALLGPGEFFGEMALLEGLPRSASARCEKTCLLVEVDGPTFGRMIEGNAEIAVRLLCKLAGRVRELGERVQRLYADRGAGRAVEVLSFLLPASGPLEVDAADLRKSVHDRTGMMPWEIDAVLVALEQAGCVTIEDSAVKVSSREALVDYARYLELGRKYESAGAEIGSTEGGKGMERLLRALDMKPNEVDRAQTVIARHYQDYLDLKKRFDQSPAARPKAEDA
jgi:CRP/FNR family cyclic AMP-dependent transcriptional regulator